MQTVLPAHNCTESYQCRKPRDQWNAGWPPRFDATRALVRKFYALLTQLIDKNLFRVTPRRPIKQFRGVGDGYQKAVSDVEYHLYLRSNASTPNNLLAANMSKRKEPEKATTLPNPEDEDEDESSDDVWQHNIPEKRMR